MKQKPSLWQQTGYFVQLFLLINRYSEHDVGTFSCHLFFSISIEMLRLLPVIFVTAKLSFCFHRLNFFQPLCRSRVFLIRCLDFFQLFLWRGNLIFLMRCGDFFSSPDQKVEKRVKTNLTVFLRLKSFLFFSEWFWFKYKNTRRKTSVNLI